MVLLPPCVFSNAFFQYFSSIIGMRRCMVCVQSKWYMHNFLCAYITLLQRKKNLRRDWTIFRCSVLKIWTLTFTAKRYLPPYTPHVGPLDPVTFKDATLFTCIRDEWRNASLFVTPFYATRGSFGPGNVQRSRASLWVYGSIRPTTGFHYPKS